MGSRLFAVDNMEELHHLRMDKTDLGETFLEVFTSNSDFSYIFLYRK